MNQFRCMLCIAMLFACLEARAQQERGVFHFTHIPAWGDTSLTGWLYHPGDDSTWAAENVDEHDWQETPYPNYFSDFRKNHPIHIGWFRLKIVVPPELRNTIVGLATQTSSATEIYVNQHRVGAFGTISRDPMKVVVEVNNLRPIPVLLSSDSVQVIAVRFAYRPNGFYLPSYTRSVIMSMNIGDPRSSGGTLPGALDLQLIYMLLFLSGISFVIFVLHGSFFIYYPKQKQNLYYSCYALLAAVTMFLGPLSVIVSDFKDLMHLLLFFDIILVFGSTFLVLTIYSIVGYSDRRVVRTLLFFAVFVLLSQWYLPEEKAVALMFFTPTLFVIESTRQSFRGMRNGSKVAKIFFIFLSSNILFGVATAIALLYGNTAVSNALVTFGPTLFLIGFSIAIARQLADTNVELQHRLVEVQSLSAEKEILLSDQNQQLEQQVRFRTNELNQSLLTLQSAQAQLIHSEKMASLGELTAGIAHEIQNPLNFVNNFSDINVELIDELELEADNGNLKEVQILARDIRANEAKINHHGKRADGIVKGMLQHSRSSNHHEKELTDLNKLCDEYLRLSYHGLRAKDKSFNASFDSHLAADLPQVLVNPQDIGRVLLNVINNAFYAVHEKNKALQSTYEAKVSLVTAVVDSIVEVRVSDNGNGISNKSIDKIFQPFFTTKPTGEGTGLGLSLSYDIIKAHGGNILVETIEAEGTSFLIQLPITN